MFARLQAFWSPPEFADRTTSDHARLTFLIARLLLCASLLLMAVLFALDFSGSIDLFFIASLWSIGFLLIMALVRRGRLRVATWAIPGLMLVGIPLLVLLQYTPLEISFGALMLSAVVATLLIGRVGAAVFGTMAVLLTLGFLGLVSGSDASASTETLPTALHAIMLAGIQIVGILVIAVIAHQLFEVSHRDRKQAEQLEASHRELANVLTTLRLQTATVKQANTLLAEEVKERERVQSMLQALVAGTAAVTGDDFMRSLSLELVRTLSVRYILITELLEDHVTVRTLACRDGEELLSNFTYALQDTPCHEVIREQRTVEIVEGAQAQYPLDQLLVEMNCESYYAEPLMASTPNTVIGHLALMDVKPMQFNADQRMLVKIFAARTAVELERERAEQALLDERALLAQRVEERTAELVDANSELSRALQHRIEFLASVSHELRTPLNVVIGMTDALVEGVYGQLNERQSRSLTTVNQSGRELLEVINDILDMAKLEAGQITLRRSELLLDGFCRACVDNVRLDAETKGLTIEYSGDDRLKTIHADSMRLRQILLNLLSNAVKFTHAPGRIGLDVSLSATDKQIKFAVWDTGIGIAPDDMSRLFQPFVQIDARLNRHFGGTGLGLVIVKRLTELHQGTISVESTVGHGSRFVVSLPLNGTAQPEEMASSKT